MTLHTTFDGLIFRGEIPQSDLLVRSGHGGFLVVSLLKALLRDWTFSGVVKPMF
jgi:hypothetical protein